jgi:hypothetical protein
MGLLCDKLLLCNGFTHVTASIEQVVGQAQETKVRRVRLLASRDKQDGLLHGLSNGLKATCEEPNGVDESCKTITQDQHNARLLQTS